MKYALIIILIAIVVYFLWTQPALLNIFYKATPNPCGDGGSSPQKRPYQKNWWDSEGDPIEIDMGNGSCVPEYLLMTANFSEAAQRVLSVEGGYTDDSRDNGNWTGCRRNIGILVGTNHGISACTYKDYYGRIPTKADMQSITQTQALEIYKHLYWDECKAGLIFNQPIADLMLDTVVQHGVNGGRKLIQIAVNERSIAYYPKLYVDGNIGNKSIAAINFFAQTNPALLYNALKAVRRRRYEQRGLSQPYYLNGWLNRLETFNDY